MGIDWSAVATMAGMSGGMLLWAKVIAYSIDPRRIAQKRKDGKY